MADRCHLELTLRRDDLDRFGAILDEPPGIKWWVVLVWEPAEGIIEVAVQQANYALYEEREQAAAQGIPFLGHHGQGYDYEGCVFASLHGVQLEAYVDRDGLLCLQLAEDMTVLTDLEHVRAYLQKRRAAERLFGIAVSPIRTGGSETLAASLRAHYLLHIVDDVDPQLHGPYPTEGIRDDAARRIKLRCGDEDGLYRLDMTADSRPVVSPYGSTELESMEVAA